MHVEARIRTEMYINEVSLSCILKLIVVSSPNKLIHFCLLDCQTNQQHAIMLVDM